MKLTFGLPEEAGMSADRIRHLEKVVAGWVENKAAPAVAMLVARNGVIVSHEAFGPLTPEPGAPALAKDSIFPLASLSKPVTATCMMTLVEDGLLELTDSVSKYIPEFIGEGKDAIKIHHLLTHTAGMRDEDVHNHSVKEEERQAAIPEPEATQHPNIHKRLHRGYGAPLWKAPGTEMRYFNYGYLLLGELIRRLSGRSLHDYAAERIFEPLGMKDTFFVVPDDRFDRVVERDDQHYGGKWYSSPDKMRLPSAAGGLYSTVMDLAIFGQMFLNKGVYGNTRILSPLTVGEMVSNQIPGIPAARNDEVYVEASWGYGWNVRGPKRDDSGSLRTARAFDHGGAGGVRLLVEPEYGVLWVYLSIESTKLYTRNLFNNVVMSAITV
jgi:CubicO group peptidase (beta-lactamase class C family)